ncbi:MAG TPA: Fe-S cluster assembly protein SufD [Stellaceae bacterium]|nr:Fe-S cluster assembly protein SufD [Stellaceae bacterium]
MSAKPETAPYRAAFDAMPAGEFDQRRRAALAQFETLGFPTRRDEAWRFTDLKPLHGAGFPPHPNPLPGGERVRAQRAGEGAVSRYALAGDTHRIVIVNGRFVPELSRIGALPTGALLLNTAALITAHPGVAQRLTDSTDFVGAQAFGSLNAALFSDGFVLALDTGVQLDQPIEIVYWGDTPERSLHLRNLILLGAGSRATLIESFAGEGHYWTNAVGIVDVGAGAALRHVKLQDEAAEAIHFGQARISLAHDAKYESFVLTLGGRLSRSDSFVTFAGENAACGLFGAYLLRGEQEATNATFVDHAAPRCTTNEVFKGVVDERAHGVFLGRIAVRQDAQKTNANQLNKNLLLSPRANVDTKPELEILADDVKCSHGATVGDLDETALFYLAARGIPAPEARRMLIEAFAADALDQIGDAALRAHLAAHVQRWLGQ